MGVSILRHHENVSDARQVEDAQKAIDERKFDPTSTPPLPPTHHYVEDGTGYRIERRPPSDDEMLRWASIMLEVEREAGIPWVGTATHHPRICRERRVNERWEQDTELVPRPTLPSTHHYALLKRKKNDVEYSAWDIERLTASEETTTTSGDVNAVADFEAVHAGSDAERADAVADTVPSYEEVAESTPGQGVSFTEMRAQEEERRDRIIASASGEHGEDIESSAPSSSVVVESRLDLEPPEKLDRKDVTIAKSKSRYVEAVAPTAEDIGLSEVIRSTYFTYLKAIARFQLIAADERVRFVALSTQLAYSLGFEVDSKIVPGDTAKYHSDLKVNQMKDKLQFSF